MKKNLKRDSTHSQHIFTSDAITYFIFCWKGAGVFLNNNIISC